MQPFTRSKVQPSYRLIGSGCEPHSQLDGLYGSIDEAIADAIAWVTPLADPSHPASMIGVDVSTADGNWRTCRSPGPLLCHLPCMVPGRTGGEVVQLVAGIHPVTAVASEITPPRQRPGE